MLKIDLKNVKISDFLFKTQNTILSAAFIIAITTGVNSILGLIKSVLLASFFGVSETHAVFITADRIPNFLYSVLILGAVSTVFIPIFTAELKKDKEEAFQSASSIITATLTFFLFLGTAVFIFAPQIISLISVNKFTSEQVHLGTNLMRIMLGAQFILVAGSLVTSFLQSFKYFLIPALAPVFYNIGMILGIILLSPKYGIYGPAIGVVIGSFLHLLIQLPVLKKTGYTYKPAINFKQGGLIKMMTLIPPRILNVLVTNTVDTINNSLAILVSAPSVVLLKFATQLQSLPVGLFGNSVAQASLPTLSSQSEKEQNEEFKETFITSFHQMMFFVLPFSMILLILRIPAIRLVYGVPNFPWWATIKTSYALAFFSISIFSQSANYLITRAFYALKDTKTPVTVGIFTAIANVLISVSFVVFLKLEVWAIAFSYSITSITDMIVQLYLLNKKVGGFNPQKLYIPFIKISYSTLMMGFTLYAPMKLLDAYVLDTTRTINLIILTVIAGLSGFGTYIVFTSFFNVYEVRLLYKIFTKFSPFKNRDKVPNLETLD